MPRNIIDLTGKQFGKWTVLEYVGKSKWKCRCACGTEKEVYSQSLRNGTSTSCGCNKIHNLVGQRFGRLLVLEDSGKRNKKRYIIWKCKCDCGNICYVGADSFKNGEGTRSCGCLMKERTSEYINDLTGQVFGKLLVLEKTDKRQDGNVVWKCLCQCGNICERSGRNLHYGVVSCGCCNSKGELKISQLLKKNKIDFEIQKTFDTCRFPNTNWLAYFDFFVNNKYLIEFDGEQHIKSIEHFGGEEKFKQTQLRDKFKNEWCKKNNIPLIRIPYTRLNNLCIEDLLLETSEYLICS